MALRLTNTSSPTVAATASVVPDVALVQRASAALTVGDIGVYRTLVPEAAAIADPHRRYVVQRRLVELALEAAERPGADQAGLQLAAADAAFEALDVAPAEPVLLTLAGATLFRLGAQRGAEALFRAADALDPTVPSLEANLRTVDEVRRRKQRLVPPAAIAPRVKLLDERARKLAPRATPGDAATISLCMIVRDEEERLGRALDSARDVVDEIVVVDTGSTDRTIEIARERGARVLEHRWDDDFAAARNVGLDAATGDWILFLDADEQLVAEDAPKLRELVRRTWREGFLLTIVNRVGDDASSTVLSQDILRLFRNRPAHRFEGRVHEGVLHAMPADAPERLEPAGVRVDHDGYLDSTRAAKDKTARNLALLERQRREGGANPYVEFNLGSEYLAAGDPARAVEPLEHAWKLLLAGHRAAYATYAPALAVRLTTALRATGRAADAAQAAAQGLELFEDFTDLVFEQAVSHRAAGELEEAERLLRRCLELGDAPSSYAAVTGAGTFLAATALAEVLVLRGAHADAAEVLTGTLDVHPGHEPARQLLAFVRAATGDDPGSTLPAAALPLLTAALDARLAAVDVDGFVALVPLAERVAGLDSRERRELLACLYLDHGFVDSAADEWAAACDEHGPDAAALTGLSRVAAARGNAEDAELFAAGARELAASAAA